MLKAAIIKCYVKFHDLWQLCEQFKRIIIGIHALMTVYNLYLKTKYCNNDSFSQENCNKSDKFSTREKKSIDYTPREQFV